MIDVIAQSGTSPTYLCTIPPGTCNISIANNGAIACYIGTSANVSSSSGYHLGTTGWLSFEGYTTSAGSQIWFTPAAAGSAVTVAAFISTAE